MLDDIDHAIDFQDFYFLSSSPYSRFQMEARKGGSFGVGVLHVEQKDVETVDPPFGQLVIATPVSHDFGHICLDFGDGKVEHAPPQTEVLNLQPPNQECYLSLGGRHELLVASIPWKPLISRLNEVGVAVDPFVPHYGGFLPSKSGHMLIRKMWSVMESEDPADALLIDSLVISLVSELLRERWSQKFRPAFKVDRMTKVTIHNEEKKEPFA